ncbi:MAG: hypothetical protein Q4E32_05110 [Bacteroidales bacterium]|nr:hypothetical protein [Bacteroidales bacterium]
MKTKKFMMLLAVVLLSGASAFAQSGNETLKGDVNEDGVVDVADINAIIEIMKAGGGLIEPPTYYWYVGQTNPSTMTEISPIVTDNISPGWRLIGTTLPNYSASNKLWNASDIITTGESLAKQYIAIPANSSACPRDGAGNDASTVDIYTQLSNITISGVEYKVYETVGRMKRHDLDIF